MYFKQSQTSNGDGAWRLFAKTNWTPPFNPQPAYRGCDAGTPGASQPWCDRTKDHATRLETLLRALTLEEKIGLLSPTPALGNPCNTHTAGAPRLGLPTYMWLEESNTGVSSSSGLQIFGGRIVFRPPEKNELVLSIETGCTYAVPFPREPNTPF